MDDGRGLAGFGCSGRGDHGRVDQLPATGLAGRASVRMTGVRNTRDMVAGAVLVLIAAALLWFGRDLPLGATTRLGPGYVPRVLAVLIALFGVAIFAKAMVVPGEPMSPWKPWRVGIVLGAMLIFAVLLERLGLAVAAVVLLLISSVAAPDYRPVQSAIFAVGLTVASALIFVLGLGMNVRIMPW